MNRRICLAALAATLLSWPHLAYADRAKFDAAMAPVLEQYLEIGAALAKDREEGVTGAARSLGAAAQKLEGIAVAGEHSRQYAKLPAKLRQAAAKLAAAPDLAAKREALRALSKPMVLWATLSSPPKLDVVYCSMAKGSWLQRPGEILNPYYGKKMLHCGEVISGASKGKKGGHMKQGPGAH